MVWLHPIVGSCAVILVVWMALAGLDSRKARPEARVARLRHRRFTPVAASLCLLAAFAGTASVLWLRDDMDLAGTWHFRTGWTCALLAAAAWLSSRFLPRDRRARRVHPWIGLGLLAAAVATAFLGLEHLP